MLNGFVNPRGVPIDDLLIHAGFVRSLARDLVRDPHAADDLAQDAWVRALQRPPQHGAALRGWFATLLQNLRHNTGRGERRRAAREAAAMPPDEAPSAAQILEREQVRERLVRAVLRLDEPFRTAVLLRYYEDLPTAAIARRLGVPAATVRTRLARGIARLREVLDEQHGGARAWIAPLATWVPGFGGGTAAVSAAGIAMKKIALATAAAALFALAWVVSTRDAAPWHEPLPVAGTAATASGQAIEVSAAPQREAAVAAAAAAPAAVAVPVFPCERGIGVVHGDLVDENDEPVAGVEVVAEPVVGALPPRFWLRDDRSGSRSARTDAAGKFRIDGVVSGPVRVRTVVDGARRAEDFTTVAPGATEGPLLLRMRSADPGDWLRITVVDGEGRPAPGALVEVYGWSSSEAFASRPTDPRTDPLARGVTDAEGVFELRSAAVRAAVVFARRDALVGRAEFDTWPRGYEGRVAVRVVLAKAGSLHGTLAGAGEAPLDGAIVSLHAQPQLAAYFAGGGRRFDARVAGRAFGFEGLPAGRYSVTLSAPGVRLAVPPMSYDGAPIPNTAMLRIVTVSRGERSDVEFAVAAGGRLRGTVRSDGRPVAGARIRAVLAPLSANHPPGFVLRGVHVWRLDGGWESAPNEPLTSVVGTTDGTGAYELCSLQPGKYRVEVVANEMSFDRRMDVVVEDGVDTELHHDLVPAGVLQFAALDLTYVGVTAVGATTPAMLAIVDREFVTFPGLAPGKYEIARFHSDSRVEPVVLATAEVFAGRTTWVDLRTVVAVVTGRVTAGGEPVADAIVSWYGKVARRTDAFGAFRLGLAHRPRTRPPLAHQPDPITVSRDGVKTGLAPSALEDVVLELGRRHVTIGAVDERGVPVAVALELRSVPDDKPTTGVRTCSIERRLPAGLPTRIGPVPDWLLHGDAVFDDGVRVSISMFPGTDAMTVVRPSTGKVRVQVRSRDGKPAADATIDAWTWCGTGEPPADDEEFCEGEGRMFRSAVTGEDGIAEFAVVAGEVLVTVYDCSARVTVAPGATASATLTLQD